MTFVATNLAPLNDLNKLFNARRLKPAVSRGSRSSRTSGSVRIEGPYNSAGAGRYAGPPEDFRLPAGRCGAGRPLRAADRFEPGAPRFSSPPDAEDLEGLMAVYKAGRQDRTSIHGIEMALRAILAQPKFIYRVEAEPENVAAGQTYPISDLELASRLSFFLWSSSPGRRTDERGFAGKTKEAARTRAAGPAHAGGSEAEALSSISPANG